MFGSTRESLPRKLSRHVRLMPNIRNKISTVGQRLTPLLNLILK